MTSARKEKVRHTKPLPPCIRGLNRRQTGAKKIKKRRFVPNMARVNRALRGIVANTSTDTQAGVAPVPKWELTRPCLDRMNRTPPFPQSAPMDRSRNYHH